MHGAISTPHGPLTLPAYLPDATRGVIRSLDATDLDAVGVRAVMVNVFHLLNRPGVRLIAEQGGIHRFMNWTGPIAADSGGFQVFSLLDGAPKLGSVSNKGFTYRLDPSGKKHLLTPAKCIQAQLRLGADLLFCLDYCAGPDVSPQALRQGVRQTVEWSRACRETFDQILDEQRIPPERRPLLLGVVQGGEDPSLRRECAECLREIGFDGYGFGGWPVTDSGRLTESVGWVVDLTPSDKPRFALGIGKPENLVQAFRLGYDLFDCVMPTRDARHRRLYVFNQSVEQQRPGKGADFYRCIYMEDAKHVRDPEPVDPGCDCLCCRGYSRAYLHHLFRIKDGLAHRLASIHNLRFYQRLIAALATERTAQ
ncbi:MAG: tRNA guanosine(34) transglycosylase Tgt [Phycisphaerae bacterium]|nr:tRNA guanosine(34) transglycosylase Tgt [Phycisphaerae bacterium]